MSQFVLPVSLHLTSTETTTTLGALSHAWHSAEELTDNWWRPLGGHLSCMEA